MQTIRLHHLAAPRSAAVLDLGCGNGRHVNALYAAGFRNIVGLDLDADKIAEAKMRLAELKASLPPKRRGARVTFRIGDGTRLGFADAQFRAILCSEVLEHVPHYYRVLDEIARVLAPRGWLGVSVPRQWPETLCWWLDSNYGHAPGGHIRIFRRRELIADIEARGFQLVRQHWAHGTHSPFWWLKSALGEPRSAEHWAVRLYHRFLVWEMFHPAARTNRALARLLDPLMGKSLVLYFRKRARR